LIRYRAAWVLPICSPPIRDGWVTIDGGRVAGVGRIEDLRRAAAHGVADRDLGAVAILPGLVNAHTHLELSYLAGEVAPAGHFVEWIRRVMAARRRRPDPTSAEIVEGAQRGIQEALEFGTALVGDISNTLVTVDLLDRTPLGGRVFYELIRFKPDDAAALVREASERVAAIGRRERLRASLAAHAPYSVAPAVFRAIRGMMQRDADARCSVHLSESRDEVEFIRSGEGPWRALLEELGSWDSTFLPPGSSPVEYLDTLGFLEPRVVVVHGVHMTAADLARLAARGVTLVTCPRSNRHTGAGVPPVARFYESGVRVAVGTDSLASCSDLNVFEELAAMRAVAPAVPAAALLESATVVGARALGFDDYGTIAPGQRGRLLAVDVPDPIADVEEYLVSGVRPEQIAWLK
jgi:cytosine/adenosine deaminase-related metal-dependent hydrolase